MIEPLIVLGSEPRAATELGNRRPVAPSSPEEVQAAFKKHRTGALWVAYRKNPLLGALGPVSPGPRSRQRLLLLQSADAGEREFLQAKFEHVVSPAEGLRFMPREALWEVLQSERRADLFLGGSVAFDALVLIRGSLSNLIVPRAWFKVRPGVPRPDFKDFEIIDGGQTVRLGSFEAASDAILYEFDPEFRKRERKRRAAEDPSFGASVRRLRLQRGLTRSDFRPALCAKEVARIETGQVRKPRQGTLQALAKRLEVDVDQLASF